METVIPLPTDTLANSQPELIGDEMSSNVSRLVRKATREDEQSQSRTLIFNDLIAMIRPGFILDHLDWPSLIIASRTYVHFLVLIILGLNATVSNYLGSAPFLINIAGLWDPPGGFSAAAGIFMAFGHVVSTVISFCFFSVMMAINWRIHGYPTTEQVYASYPDCKEGDSLCLIAALLDGQWLSTKTTAVAIFCIMSCLGTHIILCNAIHPYFKWFWFYGMVSILMMAPEGCHDPLFRPWTWAKSPILCFSFAAAFKALLCCTWFPVTSSEKITSWMESTLTALKKSTDNMFESEKIDPTEESFGETMAKFSHMVEDTLRTSSTVEFDMDVCKYEISYSRFDWIDLHELANRIKSLGNLLYNYNFTYTELFDRTSDAQNARLSRSEYDHVRTTLRHHISKNAAFTYTEKSSAAKSSWTTRHTRKNYRPVGQYEQDKHQEYLTNDRLHRPLPTKEGIEDMFHQITEHYTPLREATLDCMVAINTWIADANKFRMWAFIFPKYRKECIRRQQRNAETLQTALDKVTEIYDDISARSSWTSEILLKEDFKQGTKSYILSYSLHYGFITKEFARYTRGVGKWCAYMDRVQPTASWTYFKRSADRHTKLYESEAAYIHGDLDNHAVHTSYQPPNMSQARNPDATPPRNLLHWVFMKMFKVKDVLWTPLSRYAIKVGATCIVCLVPFFVRTSLRFMHTHRGIWIAIICMISINASSADCVWGVTCRLMATIVGVAIGVVCWYISSGTGEGNEYGIGAVLAVVGIFIAYLRHFNKVGGVVMSIVSALTIVLVTIGSYMEKNNPAAKLVFDESGGVLALERLITVSIGIIVGFIGTMVPNFYTTKQSVRERLGHNLEHIGDIQADLLNYAFQRYDNPDVRQDVYKDLIITKIRAGHHVNREVEGQMAMLVWEPPLTGVWPKYHYALLCQLEQQLMHLEPLFYTLISRVENKDNIPVLLECMGWSDPSLLGSLNSVIFMGSAAIRRGEPLPTITLGNITEEYQRYLVRLFGKSNWKKDGNHEIELSKTHDGKLILVGMILAEIFYQRIDGLLLLIKSLVGEYGNTDRRVWEGFIV